MKTLIFIILSFLVGFTAGLWGSTIFPYRKIQGITSIREIQKPLLVYTIDSLSRTSFEPEKIEIKENPYFDSNTFILIAEKL